MIKRYITLAGLSLVSIVPTLALAGGGCGNLQVLSQNLNNLHPFYYNGGDEAKTTDSGIPHLPAYYGHMQTNNTYRFFNVNEMVATMIGEGKHGMWRYQDNGTVREYLKKGGTGLSAELSTDDILNPDTTVLSSLKKNYTHHDVNGSGEVYRADGDRINDNGTPNHAPDDYLNYVDLPISHAKYDDKANGGYDSHVPIDLPGWYCTMSGPEYPHARAALRFAFAQPGANKVGPLGLRAGLDIKENYLNVLRLELFPDAKAWVNTSGNNDVVDWEIIDEKRTPYELYLVERPFFNEEYIFYIIVFADDDPLGRNFSYVRPDGPYYDHLMNRVDMGEKMPFFNTDLSDHHPAFAVQSSDSTHDDRHHATPVNLFGVHHPGGQDANDKNYTIPNGACPAMGGDFGADYYGAAWPNNYQEITPLCDAVMVDIKAYANLDGENWDNPGKYLPNATVNNQQNSADHDTDGDPLTRGYVDIKGEYGNYTDPYLVERAMPNPEKFTATGSQNKRYQSVQEAVSAEAPLTFHSSLDK